MWFDEKSIAIVSTYTIYLGRKEKQIQNKHQFYIFGFFYPWFISCSVSSSHMRTFIASPFLIQWKMSSMMLDGLFYWGWISTSEKLLYRRFFWIWIKLDLLFSHCHLTKEFGEGKIPPKDSYKWTNWLIYLHSFIFIWSF